MWYKLDGDNIIPLGDAGDLADPKVMKELAEMEKPENRRHNITRVVIPGVIIVRISTMFSCLDCSFPIRSLNPLDSAKPEPVLFETMVFVDEDRDNVLEKDKSDFLGRSETQVRYHTIHGARKGHKKIVEHVKNELIKKSLGEVNIKHNHISL